ncbi:MAG: type I-D CRISPR-associated protein Cas7/Csc2, partial [Candidatus Korarchaeota archaeon]|nr:type I-D CRISPR-associated protein Cas7/Csc2 [Candidatus Korarchaeota archaeon]NIU82593.1 type I-D CRISPR-associated protein Cas7/Csc2 [Candidatus Thorarchaeota archaeon]NIW14381.1 type I-D CRISPR-associated protein Cas7/Csc2 [Candidatus Thorarchaeota archaeon]
WNIKHRVDYNSAYSLENYEDYSEVLTWNAVETPTQSTGRALGKTETTTPLVNFPSIVTLTSVTEAELIMFLKTLLTCKSYGAETRIRGEMSNYLLGIVGGYEELLTPLELNLELNAREWRHNPEKAVKETLEAYREYAAFRTK